MNAKAILFLSLLFFMAFAEADAQSYASVAGLRLGDNSVSRSVGLTYKTRVLKRVSVDFLAQTDFRRNHQIHALADYHKPIIGKRLNLFVGAGPSLGIEQSTVFDRPNNRLLTTFGNKTVGVDLIAGVEITLLKVNVSIDFKPNFNLVGREKWILGQTGVSARYVIKSAAKKRRDSRRKKRKAWWRRTQEKLQTN